MMMGEIINSSPQRVYRRLELESETIEQVSQLLEVILWEVLKVEPQE